MTPQVQKLYDEYMNLYDLGGKLTPEQTDRKLAISVLLTEVKQGVITRKRQNGTDDDLKLAADAWLEQMDVVFDKDAKLHASPTQIEQYLRVRKHLVEIRHALP
jgi:hypothetical protein